MSGQSNHGFGRRLGAWLRERVFSAHRVTYTKVQALPTSADRTSSCPNPPPSCPQPNELIWHKPIGSTSAMSLTSVAAVQLRGNSSRISPQGPKQESVKDRLTKLEQNSGGTAEARPCFWSLFRRGKRRTAKVAPYPLLEQTNTQSPSMKVKYQDLLDESCRLQVVEEARNPPRDRRPSPRCEGLEESREFGGKTISIRREPTVFEKRDKSEMRGGGIAGVDLSFNIETKRLKQDRVVKYTRQASRSSVKGNLPVVDIDSTGKNVVPADVSVAHDNSIHIRRTHGSPKRTGGVKRKIRYPNRPIAGAGLMQSSSSKRCGFVAKSENRAVRKRPIISDGLNKIQGKTSCNTIPVLTPRNESRRCEATCKSKKLLRVKSAEIRGRFGFNGGCKCVISASLDRPATLSDSKVGLHKENFARLPTKGARKSLLRVRKRMSKIPVSTWRMRRDGINKKRQKHVTFSESCLALEKEKELSLENEKELFRYFMNLHFARAKKQATKKYNRIKTTGGGAAKHCAGNRKIKPIVSDELKLLQKRKQDLDRLKKESATAKWRRKSEPEISKANNHACQTKVTDEETVTPFVVESELTTKILKHEELGLVIKDTPSRWDKSCSYPCESETIQLEKNSDEEFVYLEALMKQEAMQEEQWVLAAQGEWSYICHDDDEDEEETEDYLSMNDGDKDLMVERNLQSIIRQYREVGALNDLVRMSDLPESPEKVKQAVHKYARICRGPVPLTIMGQEKAEAVSSLSTNLYRETRRYFRLEIPLFEDLNQVFDELDLLRERQNKLEEYLRAEFLARNKIELPRTRKRKVNPRQPLWEINAGLMLIYETKVKSSTLIDVMETIAEEDEDVLVTPVMCSRETLIMTQRRAQVPGLAGGD